MSLFYGIQLHPANNKSITILLMCRFDPELTRREYKVHTSNSKWRLLVVIAIKALIAALFEKCFNYKRLKAFWYIFSSFGRRASFFGSFTWPGSVPSPSFVPGQVCPRWQLDTVRNSFSVSNRSQRFCVTMSHCEPSRTRCCQAGWQKWDRKSVV